MASAGSTQDDRVLCIDGFDGGEQSRTNVRDALMAARTSDRVVLIRGGHDVWDRDAWCGFLKSVGLEHDRRHFDYGESLSMSDWWEISYQPQKATAYTYSRTRQPFHCDNAWFSDPAEINFFVMVKQAPRGGEQFFYRLADLVDDLGRTDADLLEALTHQEVTVRKGETDLENRTRIIETRPELRVFWNFYRTEKRDPAVESMCEAFFRYLERSEGTRSVFRVRAESGDCLFFNDQKLLHGREAFEAHEAFDRVLLQSMWKFSVQAT